MKKRVITHLITGLGKGGAETMLYQVLKYKSNPLIEYRVISMGGSSYYEKKIQDLGIRLEIVYFKKHPLSSIFKIKRLLIDSDVLCCWMYHALFVGYIAGKMARIKKIIWNIRHSDLSTELNNGMTLRINKWCAKRSKKVAMITYNGNKARETHEAIGYCHGSGVVINNGVPTDEYKPITSAREQLCSELEIDGSKKILLSVARYHPIKDVPTFLEAFAALHTRLPDTVAVMCGNGIEASNSELIAECKKNKLSVGKDIFLLGIRDDVPRLLSACDLYVLHSAGEAFPNTLVQAMSCGCLCVATDVGDASAILNQPNCVCSPGSPDALFDRMDRALSLRANVSDEMRKDNRSRAIKNYSICKIIEDYQALY